MMSLKVHVPTLVIHAEDDLFPPLLFRGLDEFIPDVVVKQLKGTHWIPEEQPAVVNGAIRDFLAARVERAASTA